MPSARSSSAASAGSSSPAGPSSSKARSSKGRSQLTATEKRIWQAVQREPGETISSSKLQSNFDDLDADTFSKTCNSLLAKSLLSAQASTSGLHFVAVSKSEASTMGQLETDEGVIFSFIRESRNEGIWTKQLKTKTNLHQTVMNRCLKTLEGKGLVKVVRSVKYPTRKIYMLANLTPSVELSGGPWYTDNELDSVFIDQLCTLLYTYIVSLTWPSSKAHKHDTHSGDAPRTVYPASYTQNLPSAQSCLKWLSGTGATETVLQVENVQSLLDVLMYDGKIEKVPHVKLGRLHDDADFQTSSRTSKKKRKKSDHMSESESSDSEESGSESEEESESGSASEDSDDSRRSRKRKRKGKERHKSGKSLRSSKSSSGKHSSRSRSSSRKDKKRSRKDNTKSRSIRLSDDDSESDVSEEVEIDEDEEEAALRAEAGATSTFVYRAVRELHVDTGWTEVPCSQCPVFDFCQPGGPVNGEACPYLRNWIKRSRAEQTLEADLMDADPVDQDEDRVAIGYEEDAEDDLTALVRSSPAAANDEEEDGYEEV